jgi:hypothetical protein
LRNGEIKLINQAIGREDFGTSPKSPVGNPKIPRVRPRKIKPGSITTVTKRDPVSLNSRGLGKCYQTEEQQGEKPSKRSEGNGGLFAGRG